MTQCWARKNTYHKSWPSVEHDGTIWPGTPHGLGIGQQVVSHQVVPQMLLQAIHHGTGHALSNKHRTLNNQLNKEERVGGDKHVGNSSICPVNYVGYKEWGKRVGVGVGRGIQTILSATWRTIIKNLVSKLSMQSHIHLFIHSSHLVTTQTSISTQKHTHKHSHHNRVSKRN